MHLVGQTMLCESSFLPQIKALLPVSVIRVDQQQTHTNMAMKMKDIFSKFPLKQLSTFVAFIVIFVYSGVLDRDLECCCDQLDHSFTTVDGQLRLELFGV